MPFNSVDFILFFFLFTALYYSVKNPKSRYYVLIGGSYFFYAYLNIFNLIFLLSTTGIAFFTAKKMRLNSQRDLLFVAGVILILSQLTLAKYSYIIFSEFSTFSSITYPYFNAFILPIGISFYSLQAISLLADAYSGKYKGDISLKSITQFLSFFPQSIAGPIHRADELIPQFADRKTFDENNLYIGVKTMLWGFFCKLIVADKIAIIVTPIFSSYVEQDGLSLSIAAILYSFQIYYDFWAYSLIAIGVGKVLGFKINVNFVNPYSARSFKNFWHKWHITLSRWMRDYVYIPLGGKNQKNYLLFCFSIMTTFIVSGFWHGAAFTFILWGAMHAFLYLAEDLLMKFFNYHKLPMYVKIPFRYIHTILFFILLSLTWLIFRSDSISELITLLKKIFLFSEWRFENAVSHYLSLINVFYLTVIMTAIILSDTKIILDFIGNIPSGKSKIISESLFICVCLIILTLWGDIGGQQFLYFKF